MKITRNIWRIKNADVIKSEKHRDSLWTFGAIIEYTNGIIFVDLNDYQDEENFNVFISEEDMNSVWTIEDTLPSKFVTEDYDTENYCYMIKDSNGKYFAPILDRKNS